MEFKASENLAEQITEHLSEKIIHLQLKPGERILEAKVSEELGVSRGPIREALRILQRKRLVELMPRKGARVTEFSTQYIEWLYEILVEFYSIIIRKTIENYEEKLYKHYLDKLTPKIVDFAKSGNIREYYRAIFEFATLSMEAARNPLLEEMMTDFVPSVRRVQFASLSLRERDLENNCKYIVTVLDCVVERKVEEGVRAIQQFVLNEKKFALKTVGEYNE